MSGGCGSKIDECPMHPNFCTQMAHQVCSGSKDRQTLGIVCMILQALLTAKWPEALQYHEKSCIRCFDMEELGMSSTQRTVSQYPGE